MSGKAKLETEGRKKSEVVQKMNDAESVSEAFNEDEDPVKALMKQEITNDSVETARIMAKKQKLDAQLEYEATKNKFVRNNTQGMSIGMELPTGTPNWMKDMIELIPEAERAAFISKHSDSMFKAAMGGGGFQASSIYEQLLSRTKEPSNGGGDQLTGMAALMAVMSDANTNSQRMMLELMKDGRSNTQGQPTIVDVTKLMASAVVEVGNVITSALKPVLEKTNAPQNNEQLELMRKEIQELKINTMEEKYGQHILSLQEQIEALKAGQNGMGRAFEAVKYLQDNGVPVTTESAAETRAKNDYAIEMKKLEIQQEREKQELAVKQDEAKGRQALLGTISTIVGAGATSLKLSKALKEGKNSGARALMDRYS